MVRYNEIREGEVAIEPPPPTDAGLVFIGRIHTPWTDRMMAPRQGRHDGPVCRIEIFEPWVPALKGLDKFTQVEVISWLHQSRRDLILQSRQRHQYAWHVLAALAGASQSARHLRCKTVGIEGMVLVRGLGVSMARRWLISAGSLIHAIARRSRRFRNENKTSWHARLQTLQRRPIGEIQPATNIEFTCDARCNPGSSLARLRMETCSA